LDCHSHREEKISLICSKLSVARCFSLLLVSSAVSVNISGPIYLNSTKLVQ